MKIRHLFLLLLSLCALPLCAQSGNAVYKQRVQDMERTIPYRYNEEVQFYINRNLKSPKMVGNLLTLGACYFPIIEQKLAEHKLPQELKYLTFVESKLNPHVVSPHGAAGIWQIIPSNCSRFGLTHNAHIDERLDLYRSTEAVCVLIEKLYAMFGDWALVIAAYNCGSGTIKKAIANAGGKKDFWAIYPRLPKTTRIYMPLFIGFAYCYEYAPQHNIKPSDLGMPAAIDTIHTTRRMTFTEIANQYGTTREMVHKLNPQYLQGATISGRDNIVCLPRK